MAYKLALLVASMAVATYAEPTLWACRKYNIYKCIGHYSLLGKHLLKIAKTDDLIQHLFLVHGMPYLLSLCTSLMVFKLSTAFISHLHYLIFSWQREQPSPIHQRFNSRSLELPWCCQLELPCHQEGRHAPWLGKFCYFCNNFTKIENNKWLNTDTR